MSYRFGYLFILRILNSGVWVSGCSLTPTQQFFQLYMYHHHAFQWDDNEVLFVLDQHA